MNRTKKVWNIFYFFYSSKDLFCIASEILIGNNNDQQVVFRAGFRY